MSFRIKLGSDPALSVNVLFSLDLFIYFCFLLFSVVLFYLF